MRRSAKNIKSILNELLLHFYNALFIIMLMYGRPYNDDNMGCYFFSQKFCRTLCVLIALSIYIAEER